MLFDDKPSAEMRDTLKKHGFRWSPKNKAWQRQLTDNAKYTARQILPEIKGSEGTTLYSNPFQAVYKGYQDMAESVIAFAEHKLSPLTALGNVPNENLYLEKRQKFLGSIARVDEMAKKITEVFEQLDKTAADSVYAYLTDPTASVDSMPDIRIKHKEKGQVKNVSLRDRARGVKRLFNVIGDQLVREGLIPQESRDKFKDGYLPRVYLKHILGEDVVTAKKHIAGATMKGPSHSMGARMSSGERYKKRTDIPKVWRRLMGEVTDPAYLAGMGVTVPARDLAIIDFLRDLSHFREWVIPDFVIPVRYGQSQQGGPMRAFLGGRNDKAVSVFWLESEANRLMKQATYMESAERQDVQTLANDLMKLYETAHQTMPNVDQTKYKQVPVSRQYGPLMGMWIHKQIYEDLFPRQGRTGYPKMEALVRAWKMLKVPLNYPTVVRNLVSNSILCTWVAFPFTAFR